MQRLRHAAFLARLVLAWFALSLGVAVASPVVKPQAVELVCAGGAIKLLVKGGDDVDESRSHTLDCPLCSGLDAPPAASAGFASVPPSREVSAEGRSTIVVARSAQLPPARAPPSVPSI